MNSDWGDYSNSEFLFSNSENIPNLEGNDELNVGKLKDWLMTPLDLEYGCKSSFDSNYIMPQEFEYPETPNLTSMSNLVEFNEPPFIGGDGNKHISSTIPTSVEYQEISAPVPEIKLDSSTSINFSETVQSFCDESLTPFQSDNDISSVASSVSKRSSSKRSSPKRSRRGKAPKLVKQKLYEREEPFDDPKLERNRLNAQKAKRNREKKEKEFNELKAQFLELEKSLAEKDKKISQLEYTVNAMRSKQSQHHQKLNEAKHILDNVIAGSL